MTSQRMTVPSRLILSFAALRALPAEAADVTVAGRRVVLEYTGELVSDTEIRFTR
jgi:hypothetical protein